MNQRNYSWKNSDIDKFLYDILDVFEEGRYKERMGSIINLETEEGNQIYDGQQRMITTILILISIGNLNPNLYNEVMNLLKINLFLSPLTKEQTRWRENGNENIPKIYCVNPYDMKALLYIFNNQIKFIYNFMEETIFDGEGWDFDRQRFKCKKCDVECSRKSNFTKHCVEKHQVYKSNKKDSLIYNAYEHINKELISYYHKKRWRQSGKLVALYKFILQDIDLLIYDCNDQTYACKIFEWENNRGTAVPTLDVHKNNILMKLDDCDKYDVYDKWEHYRKMEYPNGVKNYDSKYGKRLMNTAAKIFNRDIIRKNDEEILFSNILKGDIKKNVYKYFGIIEELHEIMKIITNDKFGILVTTQKAIALSWEVYDLFILPVFYETKKYNSKLIRLLVNFRFRTLYRQTLKLSNFGYTNTFIEISNKIFKTKDYDYSDEIVTLFRKNLGRLLEKEQFMDQALHIGYKNQKASYVLLFIENCINTDIYKCPIKGNSLEHIFSQGDKIKLEKKESINLLGNLALLELKNSKNGHKGNCSIKKIPFVQKKKLAYEKSCNTLTRELIKYEEFNENTIIERTKALFLMLDQHTRI
tara:strand:- start:260 stop:2017 length:1758 start_codon:yes stop_codon:yes gene_type:complete